MNKKRIEHYAPWILLLVVAVLVGAYLKNKVELDYSKSGAAPPDYFAFDLTAPPSATVRQSGSVSVQV